MKEIVEKLKNADLKNIFIIGDVMLDEYVFGDVSRISPEAPVAVLREKKREWSLGGAANVALNCKHIGSDVTLIGIIGDKDVTGQRVVSVLKENNLSIKGLLKSSHRVTTCKKRIMSQNHQLIRVDLEDDYPLSTEERSEVISTIHSLIKPNSVIVISDYAKGVIDDVVMRNIISIAKKYNSLVLVDPKGPDFSKYKGASYMKPNLKEFKQIVEFFGLDDNVSVVVNARKICNILSLKGIIITMGEYGITFVSHEEEVFIPSIKREVFDLTGAGDTVIAFLAAGLLSKMPLKECLIIANKAAAVAISHLKTYAVSLDDLINPYFDISDKYYSDWNELKSKLKQSDRRVIFTNGCFDIIHSGHIHLLSEAKKHGDILVVGLNTDSSVKRIKGETRPLKELRERANIMSAIGIVDYVVSFEEDTPLELIRVLKPDVIVKGVDYKAEDVVGYDEIKNYGGEIVIIGWKNEESTSTLINKIRETTHSL